MNIDVKKNKNKEKDFIAVEASNGFDVNRLSGIKNIESTYILNKANNVLTKKTESELKQYFTKSKDELISILKNILEINKNDFKQENEQLLKKLVSEELEKTLNLDENKYIITFEGNVNTLPENPGTGKIFGLIGENNEITYHLFLNDNYVVLLDKKYYDENYYKRNEVNSKILNLKTKLDEILLKAEFNIHNTISKEDYDNLMTKINLIQHDVVELKSFLNI